MFRALRLGAGRMRGLRRWAIELVVVAVGVLLALGAQAWFEGRKEAATHRETIAQMDALLGRVLAQTAARVGASDCSRDRIAELDAALRASEGQWRGMPLPGLPDRLAIGHFPSVYLADSDVLPLQIFDVARENGTLAALGPADRQFYLQIERQMNWLNDAWASSSDPGMRVAVLGIDGPMAEDTRDRLRQDLALLDFENRVTVLRARALAGLARERGFELADDDRADYRARTDRDRRMFGDCVLEVDPLALTPVTASPPRAAGR